MHRPTHLAENIIFTYNVCVNLIICKLKFIKMYNKNRNLMIIKLKVSIPFGFNNLTAVRIKFGSQRTSLKCHDIFVDFETLHSSYIIITILLFSDETQNWNSGHWRMVFWNFSYILYRYLILRSNFKYQYFSYSLFKLLQNKVFNLDF